MRKLLEKDTREQKEAMSELIDMKAQMGGRSYKDVESELLEVVSKQVSNISDEQKKLKEAFDFIVIGRNSIKL